MPTLVISYLTSIATADGMRRGYVDEDLVLPVYNSGVLPDMMSIYDSPMERTAGKADMNSDDVIESARDRVTAEGTVSVNGAVEERVVAEIVGVNEAAEERETHEPTEEASSPIVDPSGGVSPEALRRSSRARRMPTHFGEDYVFKISVRAAMKSLCLS
jgi:hypothetical protein